MTIIVNGTDITKWIKYQGVTFSREDVEAPDAGRDMRGLMHRGRVAIKERMDIQTVQLTRAESAQLHALLEPESFSVTVNPYPRTNASKTMTMYSNSIKNTYVIHRANGEDLQEMSFPLVEM